MPKPISALAIVRLACGCLQALLGGATVVAGALLAGRSVPVADGVPMLTAIMLAAGAATLAQGIVGVATASLSSLPRGPFRG